MKKNHRAKHSKNPSAADPKSSGHHSPTHRAGEATTPDHRPDKNVNPSPADPASPTEARGICAETEPSLLPLLPPVEISPLSRTEKRLLLAQIIRVNPLDCPDESGNFQFDRVRRLLPAAAVQDILITETSRLDHAGKTITRRHIRIHLVDKLRALKLDEELAKQEEAAQAKAKTEPAQREQERAQELAAAHRSLRHREEQEAHRKEAALHALKLRDDLAKQQKAAQTKAAELLAQRERELTDELEAAHRRVNHFEEQEERRKEAALRAQELAATRGAPSISPASASSADTQSSPGATSPAPCLPVSVAPSKPPPPQVPCRENGWGDPTFNPNLCGDLARPLSYLDQHPNHPTNMGRPKIIG